ncbi:hypothetical protein CJD36_020395 [Flavipsychrobacter stenotrophus]|uniref:Carboxypeptidase-like regulatory domain-containing protein n=1 Tax=Flavipsychrobacter stenotrophus TaxID=2077091 RepID=A0A2S7SQH1_9BACT|nr:carboxypeptidase regulatory-like domain-containing protein [Flavipsychrobacter stenotrophus]PQJ09153.1 hypothetical protein CJD36_020395 [Flavipsychrobacter stenotrophus]
MNTKLLTSLLLVATLPARAQELYGIVTDTRREPLTNATVRILQNTKMIAGTITDFNGVYNLKLPDTGTYEIETTYIGYQTQRANKTVAGSKQTIANFFLAQRFESLHPYNTRQCGKKQLTNKH